MKPLRVGFIWFISHFEKHLVDQTTALDSHTRVHEISLEVKMLTPENTGKTGERANPHQVWV